MRVIVTRPEREARKWVEDLVLRGFDARALPLIAIRPASAQVAVQEAWRQLGDCAAVMFVSGNAVEQFFAARPQGLGWPAGNALRAWVTGPGTAAALLAAGVAPARIDAPGDDAPQFDSEALWHVVQPQCRAGMRVLIVRGADASGRSAGRDWLGGRLVEAGCAVTFVVAYERQLPVCGPEGRALAGDAAADGSVWLFSSSEAIANLMDMLPGQDWGRARAVATHPRIAQAARDAGFAVVCESRPSLDAVVASIESTA
ncbi:MAG: uroporphyrinogen-III synthase [Pseudomonadota bacterium]